MVGAFVLSAVLMLQDPDILLDRGRRLLESQDFQQAAEVFEALSLERPQSSRAFYYLGVARLRADDAYSAIAPLELLVSTSS